MRVGSGLRLLMCVGALCLALLTSFGVVAREEFGPNPTIQVASEECVSGCLARVRFNSVDELSYLGNHYDVWEVDRTNGHVLALLSRAELISLSERGYLVEVDAVLTASMLSPRSGGMAGQSSGIPGFPCYRTVEETYASLSALALDKPNLATWTSIGESWDRVTPGGNPGYDLQSLVLTNKTSTAQKAKLVLLAEFHAREYSTAEVATRFAETLLGQYGVDPDVTWLLDYNEIHIVAMGNPDGRKFAEQGYLWRKNANNSNGCSHFPTSPGDYTYGTDLNRNSDFKWGAASNLPCEETYQGPSSHSEPEVEAVQSYLRSLFVDQRGPADGDAAASDATGLFITLHSFGEMVLWPWGWTSTPAPNGDALATLGRRMAYVNGYEPGQSATTLYASTGGTDDWSYGELGLASYTFEMGTAFFESCQSYESVTWPKNRDAILLAAKYARRPYQSPSGPRVLEVGVPIRVGAGEAFTLTALADDSRFGGSGESVQNIVSVRWTVDAPSWVSGTGAHTLTASDGVYDSLVEQASGLVDTTGWTLGRHTVFVEAQDASGSWGPPTAVFVQLVTPGPYYPVYLPVVGVGFAVAR